MLHISEIARKAAERQALHAQRSILHAKFDAADTMFLERELTQLRARLFTVEFPELIARRFMPFANDIAPSAETYSYKVLTPIGDARIIAAAGAPRDIPRVDATAREVFGKVRDVAVAYAWTINELREAARLNVPISEVKARTARDAVERAIDYMLAFGDLSNNVQGQINPQDAGLTNNADVVNNGISAGSGMLGGAIATTTILNELNSCVLNVPNNSNNMFDVNAMIFPVAQFKYISQTIFNTVTTSTIMEAFLNGNKNIKTVQSWWRLKTAGAGGLARGIAYKLDPTVLEGVLPQEFEQLPPEAIGLEFQVLCTARCGGVKVYQPLGMRYLDWAAG